MRAVIICNNMFFMWLSVPGADVCAITVQCEFILNYFTAVQFEAQTTLDRSFKN